MRKLFIIRRRLLQGFCLLGIVIFSFLTVVSFFTTQRMYTGSESLHFKWDNVLLKPLYFGFILLLCWMINRAARFLTDKRIHAAAIIISILVAAFCIFLTEEARSIPITDQLEVYAATEGLFYGDYSYLQSNEYYMVYPYQLGLAGLYVVFAKAAGVLNCEILRYVQSVCAGLSVYLLFRIGRELFKNVTAQCLCLLFSAFFMPLLLYSQLLYGENIGVCMILLCIWFFLLENRWGGAKA